MKRFIFSSLFLLFSGFLNAQADTVLLEDLRFSWIYNDENGYKPVKRSSEIRHISFTVEESKAELIKICADQPFDLWINLRLFKTDQVDCIWLDLDTLRSLTSDDAMLFQITSAVGLAGLSTELYVTEQTSSENLVFEQKHNGFDEFWVLAFMMLLSFAGLARIFFLQRFTKIYFNPLYAVGSNVEDYYERFFELGNLVFVVFVTLLSSLCLAYFNYLNNPGTYFFSDVSVPLTEWLVLWLYTLLFLAFRFGVNHFSAIAFKLRWLSSVQNQDFTNFLFWVSVIIMFGLLLEYSYFIHFSFFQLKSFISLLTWSVIIYQLIVYIKLSRMLQVNKILIISYLCVSELLPAFVLVYALKFWYK